MISKDFSMKPHQEVSTNLEEKKEVFVPKRRAGIHQTVTWKSDNLLRGLLFLLKQNYPCPRGNACSWGKYVEVL